MSSEVESGWLHRIRHSTAHVMAQAVLEMFPNGKLAIGPAIEDGFYYDFDLPRPLTPQDLEVVEKRMRAIVKGKHPFVYREVTAAQARQQFQDQPYKLELIDDLESGGRDEYGAPSEEAVKISFYTHADFTDLCRGPHVENTSQLNPKAFKLLKVAGAYWRGDEKRPMLQRIYGTAWSTQEELQGYLDRLAEAEKRDHRRLGQELDLFSIQPESGAGLVLYHPKGATIRTTMEDFWRERHRQGGYDFVFSPHIGRSLLWETSGHLKWYQDGMYSAIDIEDEQYYLKPMNCPFHMLIYKSKLRSYRDLPMRYAELGTVYRYERSGTLHGMLRVRGFTQDDAHIFCRPDQMASEIDGVLDFCLSILAAYGFDQPQMELSVRDPDTPEKYAGSSQDWEMAEGTLASALEAHGLPYTRMEGEAVFYGPKIDIKIVDALGRRWQASTIQFDFNLPERFELTYQGEDGAPHRPYMVHRALYGSVERFLALLIEHYAGAFPVWLAPLQALIIPIADRHLEYGRQVLQVLKEASLRAELDERSERMNAKIRDAQLQKVPYMLILGDKEVESHTVSLRLRSGEDLGQLALAEFIERVQRVVANKENLSGD
jgi:threonyl-tRNA synthetase